MNFLKIFHRKRREPKTPPQPLRIEGCTTRLTPEPDDAELAAQALLDYFGKEAKGGKSAAAKKKEPEQGSVEYYRQLSEKIRKAHDDEARRARRYIAYTEEWLRTGGHPAGMDTDGASVENGLAELEHGLYPLQDCVEREGGELLGRWQHVLAEITIRQMNEEGI